MSKFKVAGRMYARGKVLKMEFSVPNKDPLRFFCFKDDVDQLLDDSRKEVQIYLDMPLETQS